MPAHGLEEPLGHVGVEGAHELVVALDERDRRPPAHEGLRHLQADVAAADHDHRLAVRRAGLLEQDPGVVERLHALDVVGVDAREVGAGRPRAGGDVELVEREAERARRARVAHLDRRGGPGRCRRTSCCRRTSMRCWSRNSWGVRATSSSTEPTSPADEVRDAAGRVARPRSPSRGRRSRGRAGGAGPASPPPCPRRRRRSRPAGLPWRRLAGYRVDVVAVRSARLGPMAVRDGLPPLLHAHRRHRRGRAALPRRRGRGRARSPAPSTASSSSRGRSPTPAGSGSIARRTTRTELPVRPSVAARSTTWALAAPHTRPGSCTEGSMSAKAAGVEVVDVVGEQALGLGVADHARHPRRGEHLGGVPDRPPEHGQRVRPLRVDVALQQPCSTGTTSARAR